MTEEAATGAQAALPGLAPRRRQVRPAVPVEPAPERPVARVAVDTGVVHLDRPFDYLVTAAQHEQAVPGCRVRVRFAGRAVGGLLLERGEQAEHDGPLAPLSAVVSPEPVLVPEVAGLAAAVAERWAAPLADVLRLAVPPRHARVEAAPPAAPAPLPTAPGPGPWSDYDGGPALLEALAAGGSPRAVWGALPGPGWPEALARAAAACASSGRGAVLVLPDARDVARVEAALGALEVPCAVLRADLGPAERYRRWLAVRRGAVRVAVGTRAAAWAPVVDLGLAVVWDDGDPLHDEPRSPYCTVRDVLVARAHLAGAGLLVGGLVRTAEAQLLVDSGWARPLVAPRERVRALAPAVDGTSEEQLARDPVARAARLPAAAFAAARQALSAGAPVLVQVPRRGWAPHLACARDRTPARCTACAGPVAVPSSGGVPACRWCGRPAADWRCPACGGGALRAVVVGAGRTAEELGRAFPGVPVRTSGGEAVLDEVPAEPALVVATPGAEPVAEGGYGAVLLLDGWLVLGRPELRAGEEALRRWAAAAALARPAVAGGRVVVGADRGAPVVQALVRWDPVWAAERELAARAELRLPPAARMAAVEGPPGAAAALVAAARLPADAEVLGPVPSESGERLLVRVPRPQGRELARALAQARAARAARREPLARVEVDPRSPA